ncbi:hypothetical protein Tco_1497293, partial [Tanacetum coccineum]
MMKAWVLGFEGGEVKRRKKKGHGSTGEKEQSALTGNTRDEGFAGMTNDTAIHNKRDQVTHRTSSSPLTSYEVTTGTSSSTAGTDVVKNKALGRVLMIHLQLQRADQELKEDMVISIPNVEDDGEVLHTVRVEYEWEPPRC